MRAHTHPHTSDLRGHLLWSGSLAASARLGAKVSPQQLHRIFPIPSYPIHELCATWLAWFPWGAEATSQALSAYSLCQLWLWVCRWGASSALKERLAHFGKRRCELCRRTPAVSVYCECLCMQCCQCESFMRNSVGRISYSKQTISLFLSSSVSLELSWKFTSIHLWLFTGIFIFYFHIPRCLGLFSRYVYTPRQWHVYYLLPSIIKVKGQWINPVNLHGE